MSIRRVGSSPVSRTTLPLWKALHHARVVELADSLDSGSSVLYGRAGSSPASRTKDLPVIPVTGRLFYPSLPEQVHTYLCARVVELADSLDSGSSVLYGRAGSSPASRTKDLPVIPVTGRLFYPSLPEQVHTYLCARVVELADSLDSGSSVLYGRAGSSPASRTKKKHAAGVFLFGAQRSASRTAPPLAGFYWNCRKNPPWFFPQTPFSSRCLEMRMVPFRRTGSFFAFG